MWLVIGIGDQPLNYVPPTILKLKHWEDRFQCLIIQVNKFVDQKSGLSDFCSYFAT